MVVISSVEVLLHNIFFLSITRMTPLHYASSTGDFINCTCVLVESGADPNLTDIDGKTPLHCAVLNERIGITRYLCDHDANVNAMFLIDDW